MLEKIDRLFEEQIKDWPMLARAVASLHEARTRSVHLNGYEIRIRHLPLRIGSTTAATDRESVQRRPCFLCPANLFPEQKGLEFNSEFTIYCNPFPILERHMTIVHSAHRPQRIAGQIENMIALAEALPGYFVIYNGPECGASAPDHMHFQACSVRGVPIIQDVDRADGETIPNYGRHVIVFREADRESLYAKLSSRIPESPVEPMLNLALFKQSAGMVAALFPRRRHRPSVFYSGEFTVSPATIDLCGVFVTPLEKDFKNIGVEDIRRIFAEVSG